MSSTQLRNALLATSMLAVGVVGAAQAQEAPNEIQVEAVVVTGSRLQSAGFQAPTPVTVLGGALLEQRAPTSIADVVNEIPAFRQSVTNTQNQRGNGNGGQNRVDLRGLGDVRTLVLVDGRRHVPTNLTGTLDINLIPTSLVDRVEVVTGGASAAYGSDAVSGVVNFILKDRIQGVSGSVQYGVSEHGDNIEPAVSFAAGKAFAGDRVHVVLGGDYSDNKGVGTIYSRDWGRKQPGLLAFGSAATRGNLPAQGLAENVTYSGQAAGGVVTAGPLKGMAFGTGGQPYNFQYGTVYSNLMVGGLNGPDASPFGNWKVAAPHKRYTALSRLTYDINDDTSAFFEYGYGHQESAGLSSYHQSPGIIVPLSNPFIPAALRSAMVANNLSTVTVGRYDTELGGYQLLNWTTTNRGTAGIKGKVFGDWNWDAYYEHGVNIGHAIVKTNIVEANWLAATYVVAGPNGAPVCGPSATNPNMTAARLPQVQANCQPFNIFGRNSATQGALDYIKGVSDTGTRYEQDVMAANLSGEPLSTWAGPVSVAVGIEHRKESATSQANALGQASAFLSNNGSTFSGEVSVTEGYIETGIPLAKDMAWAKALDLNAAVRHTDYSTSGEVTTWKVGLTYEPSDMLRFRVTRSRDIRAANLTELFGGATRGITANALNPINNQTGALFTVSGGNPDLKPEVADNLTAGVVFQPTWSWAGGLRVSVDYYSVDISDVIATVASADILRRCASGISQYCSLIDFDSSTFGIAQVNAVPANLNRLKTDGLDVEIAYRAPIDMIGLPGRLDVRSLTTWVDDLTTTDAVSTIDRAGSGALGGVPSWNSNLTLTYALGKLSNSLQLRYNSSIKGDATLVGPEDANYSPALANSINKNRFPAVIYVNWSAQYDLVNNEGRTLQLFGVVNNLMDKDPPTTAIIAFASGGNPYDVIGRTYKAGVRFKF